MRAAVPALATLGLALASCTRTDVIVSAAARTAQARRIAVMDFAYTYADKASPKLMNVLVAGSYVNPGAGRIVAERVGEELLRSGRYRIIERSQVESLLKEHEFQASDFASREGAKKIGKLLGVDAVLVGTVELFRFTWALFILRSDVGFRARLVDVETGEWLWSVEGRRSAYFTAPEDVASGLVRKIGDLMGEELGSATSE